MLAALRGCIAHLPDGASGFTTVELKSNHLATARRHEECVARAMYRGLTTQLWDVVVTARESGRELAPFRCTQLIPYPR